MKFILPCAFSVLCPAWLFLYATGAQNQTAGQDGAILGDWHGASVCLVKPSACHDEEALYHVKASSGPSKLSLQADKIVDGRPVSMGTMDCSYDAEKGLLHCDLPRGYVELTLTGDRLEGAMFLTDKTRWRDIKLVRVKS